MTIDEEHGLVLIPTGSASPDFYGGLRLGSNRFADSLLVLDAAHRQAGVAPAARASRSVGLRPRRPTGPRRHRGAAAPPYRRSSRRPRPACCTCSSAPAGGRCSRSPRSRVPVESRARRAGWREPSRSPALPALVSQAPVRAAGCLGHHLLGPRQVPRPHRVAAQRGHLHPARPARHAADRPATSAA